MFNLIYKLKSPTEVETFFKEILTEKEINTLSKRWRIMEMLASNVTQREIAQQLNVSLCKVTRGAKILKKKNSITSQFLIKEDKNEQ